MQFMKLMFILITLSGGFALCAEEGAQSRGYVVYQKAVAAFEKKDWFSFEQHATEALKIAPVSFQEEILYLMGCHHFERAQWEKANVYFTKYLGSSPAPKHFAVVMEYKYKIAEHLHKALHSFSVKKWWSQKEVTNQVESLFNEVITSLPKHDLGAKALYAKALFQEEKGSFTAAAETFQGLIQRFPKHYYAARSFVGLGRIYLRQSQAESPDEHLLDLARLNIKKYTAVFPQGEEEATLQQLYSEMEQVFAQRLLVAAKFFQKKRQKKAASLYVNKILCLYPETPAGKDAQKMIERW